MGHVFHIKVILERYWRQFAQKGRFFVFFNLGFLSFGNIITGEGVFLRKKD